MTEKHYNTFEDYEYLRNHWFDEFIKKIMEENGITEEDVERITAEFKAHYGMTPEELLAARLAAIRENW